MGPAPTTSTDSPTTGPSRRAPWTAQDNGSTMAPACALTLSGSTYAFAAGTDTYSANPPSTVSPIAPQLRHRFPRPDLHASQCPQKSDGSTATRCPGRSSGGEPGPASTTSPANS